LFWRRRFEIPCDTNSKRFCPKIQKEFLLFFKK